MPNPNEPSVDLREPDLYQEYFHVDRVPREISELMPWSGRMAPGVIDCKNGSYLTSFQIRGRDQESATESEIGGVHWQLSRALMQLQSPSALWYEMRRLPSLEYPPSVGTNLCAWMIDAERRRVFQAEGAHFETECFLTLGYRPPSLMEHVWTRFLYTHMPKRLEAYDAAALEGFLAQADRFRDLLKSVIPYVTPLDDAAFQRYLVWCCTMRDRPVHVEDTDLDWYLPEKDLVPGHYPLLRDGLGPDEHLRVCTIRTFPNETFAGMVDALQNVNFQMRFVARTKPLDQVTAERVLKSIEKQYYTTEVTFGSMIAQVLRGTVSRVRGSHGALYAADTDLARQENYASLVRYGSWTCSVVLCNADLVELNRQMRVVDAIIHGIGLGCKWETSNAVDAWCATQPGNWEANPVQPIINTLNDVHLKVISVPWAGTRWNTHLQGPALFMTQTHHYTPFRVSLWEGDVGNTVFVGGLGSGKSTKFLFALAQLVARYLPTPQAFIIEVQPGAKALTYAMGGQYFDLATDGIGFQPLRGIDREPIRRRMQGWVEDRYTEQGLVVTPEDRQETWRALQSLATAPVHQRTLTGLMLTLQRRHLREAIRYYTIDGPHGSLLDADHDDLPRGTWQACDVKGLLDRKAIIPAVISYVLYRWEDCLDGRPTVIACDDCAKYLGFPCFVEIFDSLMRLDRKNNLAIWFSTQTAEDLRTLPLASLIFDSCMRRLIFPNAAAMDSINDEVYDALRLNALKRRQVARSQPKTQFLFDSPEGSRMCDLDLDGLTLGLCGANSDADRKLVDTVYAAAGAAGFLEAFAAAKGLSAQYTALREEVYAAWVLARESAPDESPLGSAESGAVARR